MCRVHAEQRIIMYRDTEPLAGIANIWNNNGGEEVSVEVRDGHLCRPYSLHSASAAPERPSSGLVLHLQVVISPEYLSKDNKRVGSVTARRATSELPAFQRNCYTSR